MDFKSTYRIGVYEKAFPVELSWEERLTYAKNAGFDYLEMSIDETDMRMSRLDWDDEQIAELLDIQKRLAFQLNPFVSVHRGSTRLEVKNGKKKPGNCLEKESCLPERWGSVF